MARPKSARALAVSLAAIFIGAELAQAHGSAVHMDIISHWRFPARLGMQLQPMTEELREYFHAPRERGVLVVRLEAKRPAEQAGVQVGDVVVAVGEEPVAAPRELIAAVARAPAGEPLVLEIVRAGKPRQIEVVPEGEPSAWLDPEAWSPFHERLRRGFEHGRDELERRLHQLERRLEELERRLESEFSPREERT